MTMPEFAKAVLALKDDSKVETVGFFTKRVLVFLAWKRLQSRFKARFGKMTLSSFKGKLLVAQKMGLLSMDRADIVADLDPDVIRYSETSLQGGEVRFHYIRL